LFGVQRKRTKIKEWTNRGEGGIWGECKNNSGIERKRNNQKKFQIRT
jgi:hypothetical protein